MIHIRQAIRDAVAEAITAALPTWTVMAARATPIPDTALPFATVATPSEQSEAASIGKTGIQKRTVNVRIMLAVDADAESFDDLDAAAADIEAALLREPCQPAKAVTLVSTEFALEKAADGVARQARAVLTFEAVYYTERGVPETAR